MQKKIITVFCLLAVYSFTSKPAKGQGQQSSRISINAEARVVKAIEMTTIRDIQFNPVQPSQEVLSIDPLTDSETGKMMALGNANARIRVSFVREHTLVHENGNSTLTFTYIIAGNDQDDQSSAEILQTDNRDLTLNNEGKYYFWIGGQVNVSNAKPGNYNGNFTIEVEYI